MINKLLKFWLGEETAKKKPEYRIREEYLSVSNKSKCYNVEKKNILGFWCKVDWFLEWDHAVKFIKSELNPPKKADCITYFDEHGEVEN